jgi:hypothetical protein
MVHYIGDYIDFLSVLITDDPAIYQATRSTRESRMRIISLGEVCRCADMHRKIGSAQKDESFGLAQVRSLFEADDVMRP